MNWTGQTTSSEQGLIWDNETGNTIAVAYDPKHTALIAAAPLMLKALERITHPMAGDDDLDFALEVIRQVREGTQ